MVFFRALTTAGWTRSASLSHETNKPGSSLTKRSVVRITEFLDKFNSVKGRTSVSALQIEQPTELFYSPIAISIYSQVNFYFCSFK